MSTANAPGFSLAIPLPELEQMKGLAELLPGNNAELFAKMMFGRGLGMGPAESLSQIDWIKGKAELSANAQLARMRAYIGPWGERYDYEVVEISNDRVVLRFVRLWPNKQDEPEFLGDSPFSMEDAKTAGIHSSMYTKFGRNMLFSRSTSNGVAWYAPETTYGQRVYSPGEIDPSRDHPVPELPEGVTPTQQAMPAPTTTAGALPAAPEVPAAAQAAAEHFEVSRKANPANTQPQQQAPAAAPAQPVERASRDEYEALKATVDQRNLSDEQLDEILTGVGVPQVNDVPLGRDRHRARLKLASRSQVQSATNRAAFTDSDRATPAPEPVQDAIPGTAEEMPANQPAEGVTGP